MANKCKNCSYEVPLTYCSNCGQEHIERLTIRKSVDLFLGSMFSWDGGYGLFKTLFFLFKNPRKIVYGYIEGQRKKYYNPAGLYVIVSGLYFFIDFRNAEYEILLNDYFTISVIILSLIIAPVLTYFSFKSYKFILSEHFILALYAFSLDYFVLILFALVKWEYGDKISGFYGPIIGFLVLIYFYTRVFNKNKVSSFLKLLFIAPLFWFLPIGIISLLARIFGIETF